MHKRYKVKDNIQPLQGLENVFQVAGEDPYMMDGSRLNPGNEYYFKIGNYSPLR